MGPWSGDEKFGKNEVMIVEFIMYIYWHDGWFVKLKLNKRKWLAPIVIILICLFNNNKAGKYRCQKIFDLGIYF